MSSLTGVFYSLTLKVLLHFKYVTLHTGIEIS